MALTNRPFAFGLPAVEIQVGVMRMGCAGQHGQETLAVKRWCRRHFRTGGVEGGGEDVDGNHRCVDRAAACKLRRPTDDPGRPHAALIEAAFEAAQDPVVGVHRLRSTVVRQEKQQGVLPQSFVLEFLHHGADAQIQVIKHGHQNGTLAGDIRELFLKAFDVLPGRLRGGMDGVVGQVEEEGILFLAVDERNRFFG